MASVYELVKDRKIYTIETDRTVLEAARLMMEHNFGALPVMRNGDVVGIFSERDIMNRVVAAGRTPGATTVGEVMTPNPKTVSTSESIEDCLFLMREFGFRHVLIAEDKQVRGLVSQRDLLMYYVAQKEKDERRMAG